MSRKQLSRSGRRQTRVVDDADCTILHVDMDAFYASVELAERPELRGKPLIVGASGSRGVVLSATYEARGYGVHSAMPMSRAVRMCPHAEVIPPDHGKYTAASRGVMEILRSVTPDVEPLSLDEAFLDVSGARRRLGSPVWIATHIRAQVRRQYGITCSVGVASTKFVAKLASAYSKPDGLFVVPVGKVIAFLHPLNVNALWGVGERTEEALRRLGIRTVGELAHTPVDVLQRELGVAVGERLVALSWGRDESRVVAHAAEKSVGAEETFDHDVDDPEFIRRELLRLAERVAARLRVSGLAGRTVSVKLRRADFTTVTRSRSLPQVTDVARQIYAVACDLYRGAKVEGVRLRLVGVRVEGLSDATTTPRQLALGDRDVGWREAEQAVDRVTAKFGRNAIRPAALVESRLGDPQGSGPGGSSAPR